MIHYWEHLTHIDFKNLKDKQPWAILPIGSIEQHGPHLPVGTDSLIMRAALAEAVNYLKPAVPLLILPQISYGKSVEHLAYIGTLSLSARTLLSLLDDIANTLSQHGFRRLIILNSHGGNIGLIDGYLQDLRCNYQMRAFLVNIGRFFEAMDGSDRFDMHGGEIETSLLMHWQPDLVRQEAIPSASTTSTGLERLKQLNGKASWGWSTGELTDNGLIGSPQRANAARGKALADRAGKALAEVIGEIMAE